MRLLKRVPGDTFELTSFDDDDPHPPPYAILSHTWVEDQEVTYHELKAGAGRDKSGFNKIRFCGEQAAADGLQFFWVDTCCIDKTNNDELSTAINFMFRWYQRASKCYVYLSDVSVSEHDAATFPIVWADAFRRSRWFTRGWTLQELMAPASVEFFSREGKLLGSKISLEHEIHNITKIPISALRGHSLAKFSREERKSWVASRETTVKEDRAYCLLGIFGVFLPFIRGEGEEYAMTRLEEEIQKRQEGRGIEQVNLNAARPETRRPSCVIPFRRDPDFIDRGTLLDELQEKCSAPASRVALVGLGGVGKSQVAIEYCYRTADRSPETWVFWVHAGNAARLEQSYRDIANQVELAGRTDKQADVFELVRNWLLDERNGKWLLVLDNADDDAVFASLPCTRDRQHLSRYLPPSKYGTVIVTSRSAHAASRLVEDRETLHLGPMDDIGAQGLLRKKLGDRGDVDVIDELAAALEYMPLALVQAAAYIQKRAPHYSVQRYLKEFHKSDKRKASLLNQEAGHLRRHEGAKNSIIVTWQISFEHIRSIRRSAADLLSLMSFFDRQGIPEALLRSQSAIQTAHEHTQADEGEESDIDEEQSASEGSIDDAFIDDIMFLRDYSFISETTDSETLEMHSLVQLATQKWLEGRGEAEGWKEQFVSILCRAFPTGRYENWERCQVLFPHATAALRKRPRNKESCKQWARLCHNAASYAWQRGSVDDAETLATAAMEARSKLLGNDSIETLGSMAMVGLAKRLGGRWEEAEKLQVHVMEAHKTKLGANHPDTLTSIGNLASTFRNQGRWEEAEKLQVQVLETRKTKLGADHPDTLVSMGNLASIFRKQGRWDEAEKLEVQVMETHKTKLGADHPHTLTSIHNLASTYRMQGRWEEAEKLQVQVLETHKTKLGADYLDTLISMGNLASIFRMQGRWDEAEKLEVQVMETHKTKLGADHPHTLTSIHNLASTYRMQGRWEEAEKLQVQVMKTRKTKLRADHPDTLASIGDLASTFWHQGRWEEAGKLQVQVMETRKTKLGADHPDTLISMGNLALTWKSLGRNAEAIALLQQCARKSREVLRADHPDLLSSLTILEQWEAERADADLCSKFEGMLLAEREG
ncbi:hypothetical protein N0V90_013225 [Kalmusia sp. IMI 367209]|nr:hypothetical protein N0V90_013225 [Kalmusia sp. IMI 367209]